MKLSFSTNRWNQNDTEAYFRLAEEYRFAGVEIHSVSECPADKRTAIYHAAVSRGISIPCIDVLASIGSVDTAPAMAELRRAGDALESVTAAEYWPFPTYGELLFGVR